MYVAIDGFLEVSPACSRAVEETVAKLREAGHDVVEFKPPK
jgi:Asp-tRNA(Asn)/Glu-tRNA(Gln) amidotransferase A subunit family amidase